MHIDVRQSNNKWIAYVWDESPYEENVFNETFSEDVYDEINQWCVVTIGYQSRTAYNVFEFKKQSDLNWFLLRWQ
jgi:hypothetical protein